MLVGIEGIDMSSTGYILLVEDDATIAEVVTAMDERPRFFRAEIIDGNGTVRDVVIVNKSNGRVRSTY
jgi:hypothetical protein